MAMNLRDLANILDKLSSQNTENGFAEPQDFKIFWGKNPRSP